MRPKAEPVTLAAAEYERLRAKAQVADIVAHGFMTMYLEATPGFRGGGRGVMERIAFTAVSVLIDKPPPPVYRPVAEAVVEVLVQRLLAGPIEIKFQDIFPTPTEEQ